MTRTLVAGARGSALSRRQVEIVVVALTAANARVNVEFREIKTHGDRSSAPLSEIGGLGVFTKAIEDALLAGEIDIAVHSLKDLPPILAPGLVLGATPERADVRDALVSRDGRTLAELQAGARIGTGSARRGVQLIAARPDIEATEIRGNVPTRIAKVEAGEYDGAVLALAGLARLGLEGKAAQIFSVDEMVPAVGQGAIAVEVRADDADALECVSVIDDPATRVAVTGERAFLERLGAGCRMPVGAYGIVAGSTLTLNAMLAANGAIARRSSSGPVADAARVGTLLADAMIEMTAHA